MKHKDILKGDEIQDVIKNGSLIKTKTVVCYWKKKVGKGLKIGVAISKKIKPIWRKNKAKRQLKALLRNQVNWSWTLNLVFIAKANYLEFDDNGQKIREIIKKLTVLTTSLPKITN